LWSQAESLLGLHEARVATASVSRHIDQTHLASSGIAASNFAEFHERAVFEFSNGDSLLPDAQAQNVLLRDVSNTISSTAAITMLISGGLTPISLSSEFRDGVFAKLPCHCDNPSAARSRRMTGITQDVAQSARRTPALTRGAPLRMLAVRTTASPSDADRLTYTVPLSGLAKSRRARVSLPRCSADGRRIIQNTLKAVRPSIATPLNAPRRYSSVHGCPRFVDQSIRCL